MSYRLTRQYCTNADFPIKFEDSSPKWQLIYLIPQFHTRPAVLSAFLFTKHMQHLALSEYWVPDCNTGTC